MMEQSRKDEVERDWYMFLNSETVIQKRICLPGKLTRLLAVFSFVIIVILSSTACGRQGSDEIWTYVPEFTGLEEKNIAFDTMLLSGDAIYFFKSNTKGEKAWEQGFFRYSLADGQAVSIPLNLREEGSGGTVRHYSVGEDGSIYVISWVEIPSSDSGEISEGSWFLHKFDEKGNEVFSRDITAQLQNDSPFSVAADSQGHIYVAGAMLVLCYDGDGTEQGSISVENPDDSIVGMGCAVDGRVYVSCYHATGGRIQMDFQDCDLAELDFENRRLGNVYSHFRQGSNSGLIPGADGLFLSFNDRSVYQYGVNNQSSDMIFDWIDCNLEGAYSRILGVLEDGRIVAAYGDAKGRNFGLALLTRTKLDPGAQKEKIILATMVESAALKAAVVEFNKSHDKYQIVIWDYFDENISGMTLWNEGITRLNNDIISDRCPDMIDLYGLDVDLLAKKGVFEDLNPYLEKSARLNREDFLEGIINAYTFDNVLTAIPYDFCVQTVAGSSTELAGIREWTIEEVIAFAEAHPGAQLFDRVDKGYILEYLMRFNEELFIDWSTGECRFDSEEFKRILQFAASLPDESDQNGEKLSRPMRVQKGEVLLMEDFLYNFSCPQVHRALYRGDVEYIGYPTVSGDRGHYIIFAKQIYGITTKSEHKEMAWEFIESVLTRERRYSKVWMGFCSLKSNLEAQIWEALHSGYVLDENGELMLDENGEPIIKTDIDTYQQDDFLYSYRPITQDEIDLVLKVIDEVSIKAENDNGIMSIISEEAAAFFAGQKTVNEVAALIQNRISIYVSERM